MNCCDLTGQAADVMPTPEEKEKAEGIRKLYAAFGIQIGELTGVSSGARVTGYEFQLDPSAKVAKILQLSDDISLNLSVPRVRLICPIPGKSAFRIEVPNGAERLVAFDEVFSSPAFTDSPDKLCVVLGKDLSNENVCLSLSKAPHVLIGGQACSGKSNILNNMILSLICATDPSEVKLLLADPEKQSLGIFENEEHLLEPVIYDAKTALDSLNRLFEECYKRYQLFQSQRVRNIDDYNRVAEQPIPRIVAVVDEFSCLARLDLQEFELTVSRLAQTGRAAGIHMILATKDLTHKTVTGIIKANIPTRIALSVETPMESRTIMDSCDARCLLPKGDMLLCSYTQRTPLRVQAAYLTAEQTRAMLTKERKA